MFFKNNLLVFLFIFILSCCSTYNNIDSNSEVSLFNEERIESIKANMPFLDLTKPPLISDEIASYFYFYNIDYDTDAHYFGYYNSGDKRIACHIFLNNNSKGTVILLHGYIEHSAYTYSEFINIILRNGYTAVAIDLPGHGFSDGRRGDSRDFYEYFSIINDFYNDYLFMLPEPYSIIGHSLGCVGIFESLYDDKVNFNKYILVAPIIRSNSWVLSKIGMFFLGWMIPRLPVLTSRGSTNREEAKLNARQDPLFVRSCPTSWARSLYIWERKTRSYEVNNNEIFILQGQKDRVLDWEYNISYFKDRFPNLIINFYPDSNHTLLREPVKNDIFQDILYYLDN